MAKVKHVKKANSLLVTFLIMTAIAATAFSVLVIVSAYKSDIKDRMEALRNTVLNAFMIGGLW